MFRIFNILHLEDNLFDAELIHAKLLEAGLQFKISLVQNREEFEKGLKKKVDIILADNQLPSYDGLSALSLRMDQCPDIPFIFVTGAMGEEAAVETLTLGATDFVLKRNLSRLPPAVKRALHDSQHLRERKLIEKALMFLAQRGWMSGSNNFFEALVLFLGQTLNVELVIIDRLTEQPHVAETLAFFKNGSLGKNLCYNLKGTPCESIIGRQLCIYPQGVQDLFPEDSFLEEFDVESYIGIPLWDSTGQPLGLIALMDSKPNSNTNLATQILQVVATRAAAEVERERSDQILRQQEKEFRTLAENSPDNIARYDTNSRIVYANPALEKTLGLSASEMLGKTPMEVSQIDGMAAYQKKIIDVVNGGVSSEMELVIPVPLMGNRYHHIRFAPERGVDGVISGVLALGRDITEKRVSEEERKANLLYFEKMDLVNRAIQGTNNLERMMRDVLDVVLNMYDCDGAFLLYPCDPHAASWNVPMERNKPEWPRVLEHEQNVPMDEQVAQTFHTLLSADGPVGFGPNSQFPLPDKVSKEFGFKSLLSMALNPKEGKSWLFGLHQGTHARVWTQEEVRLFKNIGRRVGDALTSLLVYRNLLKSERRYVSLINQASDAIFVHDLEGRFLEVNQMACENLGYLKEELLGMKVADIDVEFYSHDHAGSLWSKLKPDHAITLEGKHRRKDGTTFPVEVRLGLLQMGDRQVCLALARDITKRKDAEQAIQEKQELLLETQRMAHIGNWSHDLVTDEIYWSDEFFRILGIKPQKPSIELVKRMYHPDDLPGFLSLLEDSTSTRTEYENEFRIIRPSEEVRWIQNHWIRVFDKHGKEVKRLGTYQDITERKKRVADQLRFTAIIEQTADSIVITDKNAKIQYVNPSFEKRTGYFSAEVLGKNPRILKSGQHSRQFYKEMWDTLNDGKVWRGQFINMKKDGTLFNEEASITPVLDDEREIINFVGIKRDVTEQKKLEEQLQQAQKMEAIGSLAGGIAHDFNNILAAIIGYTELAKEDRDNPTDLIDNLDQVYQASLRAKELVKQILTFSRRGQQAAQPLQVQLVVKEAVKLLRSSIPATIKIKPRINPNCETISADPTQIHQVVMNLCTNAYHAMRETGGVLEISLDPIALTTNYEENKLRLPPGPYLKLAVSDTGTGIPKHILNKIFEPYFTTKEKGEGTGFGLAVVHGIVTRLQGGITVSSKLNVGTIFQVFLPASGPTGEKKPNEIPQELPSGKERILVLDDNLPIAKMTQKALKNLGYQVTASTNSLEALNQFMQTPDQYDLIITDMTMPDMTGADLARRIFSIRPDMKIILSTGFSDLIDKKKAIDIGFRDYLVKPVVMSDLANSVRKVLDS